MGEYDRFAAVYNELMEDAEYPERTEYLLSLFKRFDAVPSLLLDLACGTGGFSNLLALRGIEVIGVDASEEMLAVARQSATESGADVLYLCQRAEELDLYGTVEGIISCLDSLNHITDYSLFCRALERAALFLEKGRLFIFDLNTPFKHRLVLGDNTFVTETEDIYCVWRNKTDPDTLVTDIDLDFFIRQGTEYIRSGEELSERAYTDGEITAALKRAGLELVAVFDDMTYSAPTESTERAVYVTRRL